MILRVNDLYSVKEAASMRDAASFLLLAVIGTFLKVLERLD